MFRGSHGIVALLITSCVIDTCSNFSLSKLVKGDEIVRLCDRHSNETVTLRKLDYFNFRKLFYNFNFVRCWGSGVMLTFLNEPPVRIPLIEKSMLLCI